MAKSYSPEIWKAIKRYWENNPKASYNDAAKSIGADAPSKAAVAKKAVEERWSKKSNQDIQKRADIEGVCRQVDDEEGAQVDGVDDENDRQVDGESDKKNHAKSIATINNKAKRKADLKQSQVDAQVDGLAGLIASNAKLTDEEVDEICADFRAGILQKHRGDFDQIDAVVNTCVGLFKKAMDAIASGGYANENDVIDGDGFVHVNLMNNLKLADATIKSMFNVTLIKTNKQNNERKSYGLDTYEEPNSGGDLAKKALSQTGMGNHYERIRLGKPDEKTLLRGRLKGAI